MDLALNNLQKLICHKAQTSNQSNIVCSKLRCKVPNNKPKQKDVWYRSNIAYLMSVLKLRRGFIMCKTA